MQDDINKLINEYPANYCRFLEVTYGANMMSEGGAHAIDNILAQESDLSNKHILDVGFGLGGAAFHIANTYGAFVYGLEINPWLVKEASRRIPRQLDNQINFLEYHPMRELPFEQDYFDVVFSKGVLTHLKNKSNLFQQINRILKPGGSFVIDDWLSPIEGTWGEKLNKMCEEEGLTLYAETESNYKKLLKNSQFTDIQMYDQNKHYYQYNLDIVNNLKCMDPNDEVFNEISLNEAIEGHQIIADSIKNNELLIRWFRGVKP